jgi:hypothetical protein
MQCTTAHNPNATGPLHEPTGTTAGCIQAMVDGTSDKGLERAVAPAVAEQPGSKVPTWLGPWPSPPRLAIPTANGLRISVWHLQKSDKRARPPILTILSCKQAKRQCRAETWLLFGDVNSGLSGFSR